MNFKNKIVWITGASAGIGEALAGEFHKEGATLILSARRAEELERVKKECGSGKVEIFLLPLDVADEGKIEEAVKQALGHFGHVDILINNAGITQRSYFKDTDMAVYRKLFEVNFFGPVALTKALLPSMIERKSGHIVAVGSVAGKFGTPLRSGYSATKFALNGFHESIRAELWKEGVSVTVAIPGAINTQISMKGLTGDGSPHGVMDDMNKKGTDVAECARKIVRGVYEKKEEIVIAKPLEIGGLQLKRFAPGVLSKMLRKVKVT